MERNDTRWSQTRYAASPALGLVLGLAVALALPVAPGGALAQDFETVRVATGVARPVYVTAPPGDTDRAFILEQHTGNIRILRLDSDTLEPTPFLTVPQISTNGEQGLLGLAFHPDYATNGQFYVYFTDANGDSHVARFTVSADPDVADVQSETPLLSFSQPQTNHNAGWIGFGPDGLLYIASGDGGGSNDQGTGHTASTGNAQDVTDNLLGKILRIDVDGDDFPGDPDRNYAIPSGNPFVGVTGDDEIWAFGLRNPWRSSFDRQTGDLYIADVGQDACEELNVQPAGSQGGENYGWRVREGVIATPGVGGPLGPGMIDPIFDYPQEPVSVSPCSGPGAGFTGDSITGGYVYRGPVAALQGRYFFADFGTAELWSLVWDGSAPSSFDGTNYTDLTDHTGDPRFTPDEGNLTSVTSFGEDAAGNLYVTTLGDDVFRVPEARPLLGQVAGILTLAWLVRARLRARPSIATLPWIRDRDAGDHGAWPGTDRRRTT